MISSPFMIASKLEEARLVKYSWVIVLEVNSPEGRSLGAGDVAWGDLVEIKLISREGRKSLVV